MTENMLITKEILDARFFAIEALINQSAEAWLIGELRRIASKANADAAKFLVNQQRLQGFIALLQNHDVQQQGRGGYPEGWDVWVVDGKDVYDAGMDEEDAGFAWLYNIDSVHNFNYYIKAIDVNRHTKKYVLRQLRELAANG